MNIKIPRSSSAQSLVELLLAIAIAAIIIPGLLTGFVASREGKAQQNQRIDAVNLLKEASEAVRSVRQRGWDNIATNGTFHPEIDSVSSNWKLMSNSETISGFVRKIDISDVKRDSSGTINETATNIDPSTKKVTITVSWSAPSASSIVSTMYFGRLDNLSITHTTTTQFNQGTKGNVAVVASPVSPTPIPNDGEIILGAGGGSDWCAPNLSISAVDLPKNGVANAISAIQGKAFSGTGDNASGISYGTVDIDALVPPHATVSGTFDGYKTNGIYGESNYAYLATDTNGKQGEIINLTVKDPVTKKYQEAGSLDLGTASVNGNSIFVNTSTSIAYLAGTDGKLYAFNVSSRSGTHSSIASVNLAGTATKIIGVNDKIYASINSASTQMQIVPLLNNGTSFGTPVNITVAGQAGKDIYINSNGTLAYLATASSASQHELFIIDTNPSSATYKQTLAYYDTNGMNPKGVGVVTNNKAIIVGTGGTEYQVVDLSSLNPPYPVLLPACGSGLNIDTGINGIASLTDQRNGLSYSYIITGDATTEFKMIEGGPGGAYTLGGTYTSPTLDFSASQNYTAFNRILATVNQPLGTSIKFQVAVANINPVSGNCSGANFQYVGPNGTQTDYFTPVGNSINGLIPFTSPVNGFLNPGKCFRYQATLSSSDQNYSPSLYDVTINYSP